MKKINGTKNGGKAAKAGAFGMRGERMTRGKGWRLINVKGGTEFVGTLLHTIHGGGPVVRGARIAIFSVWKPARK